MGRDSGLAVCKLEYLGAKTGKICSDSVVALLDLVSSGMKALGFSAELVTGNCGCSHCMAALGRSCSSCF